MLFILQLWRFILGTFGHVFLTVFSIIPSFSASAESILIFKLATTLFGKWSWLLSFRVLIFNKFWWPSTSLWIFNLILLLLLLLLLLLFVWLLILYRLLLLLSLVSLLSVILPAAVLFTLFPIGLSEGLELVRSLTLCRAGRIMFWNKSDSWDWEACRNSTVSTDLNGAIPSWTDMKANEGR